MAFVAAANAQLIPGLSTRSVIAGPDGGTILHEESPGVIAETGPVLAAAPFVEAASTLAYAPSLAYSGPIEAYSAPSVAYSASSVPYSAAGLAYSGGLEAYSTPALGYSAFSLPYSSAALAYSAPNVGLLGRSYGAPSIFSGYSAPLWSNGRVLSGYSAPTVSGVLGNTVADTVISGPSGTIATGRSIAAPLVSSRGVYASAPLLRAW